MEKGLGAVYGYTRDWQNADHILFLFTGPIGLGVRSSLGSLVNLVRLKEKIARYLTSTIASAKKGLVRAKTAKPWPHHGVTS